MIDETTPTSAEQLDAMLSEEKITQEQYDELREALETQLPPPLPEPETKAPSDASINSSPRRLTKSWSNRLLGGVCGGLANHFGISPDLVRILAIVALLVALPITLIVYFACYFLLPWDDPEAAREPQEKGRPWRFAGTLSIFCLIHFIFTLFVVPQFTAVFEGLGAALPFLTKLAILIAVLTPSILGIMGQILLIALLTGIYQIIHKPKLRMLYAMTVNLLLLLLFIAIVMAYLLPIFSMVNRI